MFDPWVRKIPWRKEGQPTLEFLPGEFHGQRSLMGYSPWSRKVSDMTEELTLSPLRFHFHLLPLISPLKHKTRTVISVSLMLAFEECLSKNRDKF